MTGASHRVPVHLTDDSGSSTVLGIALCVAILMVAAASLSFAAVFRAESWVQGAADAASLVAADTASGLHPGVPCDEAERVASANGARIVRCDIAAAESRVIARVETPFGEVSARSRAGPADSGYAKTVSENR